MLDLSPNSPVPALERASFKAFRTIGVASTSKLFALWVKIISVVMILALFLPWTQNIRARGTVTSLSPNLRPQTIHAIIPGRLEEWFVQEGQLVQKGDTILRLSEVKAEYFDPQLLDRTQQQITAKELTGKSYEEKVHSLDAQIDALTGGLRIKLEQAQNKIQQARYKLQSDSIRVVAATTEIKVADDQYARGEQQFKEGLISKVELERRQVAQQRANATLIDARNKLLDARNELLNAELDINGIRNDYRDKLSKAESEKFSSMSQMYTTEGEVSKMQVDLANYTVRAGNYIVTAPQDGYITKAIVTGVGETVKEGDPLVSVMPAAMDMAVELYVRPMDMPLINKGQKVRFMFDGWPSIVFSGWPNSSYGTFGGEVVAIDNFISPNGKYRILVGPDKKDQTWPTALRVGGGAVGFALMSDVPIWYELWRQINGFPPDLYMDGKAEGTETDQKIR
ncbi:MAG: HlyD family efflux transporter periplasmic adaptor subunit [Flavobacteriales bacterium]|nr:HlyD family efflux transporter periplasmic adaptor subunit [Flavobacteriales bacterium]